MQPSCFHDSINCGSFLCLEKLQALSVRNFDCKGMKKNRQPSMNVDFFLIVPTFFFTTGFPPSRPS